ncbi:MAG: hypothetical protein O3B13_25620, partial [Planctomycetota bacterium]|nr:hypothetical protein [Planctomycetota bacterium]
MARSAGRGSVRVSQLAENATAALDLFTYGMVAPLTLAVSTSAMDSARADSIRAGKSWSVQNTASCADSSRGVCGR